MIRKLNDDEYKQVHNLLPALEFAYNTALPSVLNVISFGVWYGGKPRTIATAKTEARQGGGGIDPGILGGVCTEFDKSITKNCQSLS